MPLDDTCVLIGENNTGKSSILHAIRICLTRSFRANANIFDEYDYHLPNDSTDPTTADPINVTLTFSLLADSEGSVEARQVLRSVIRVDKDPPEITLCITSEYDLEIKDFITKYKFLDSDDEPYSNLVGNELYNLQRLIPFFYLESLRDAAKEFNPRSTFWKPFIQALDLDEIGKQKLEEASSDLNSFILEKHIIFKQVKEKLEEIAGLMPIRSIDPVQIEAVPSSAFDILARTRVHLISKTEAQIPIELYGSGTQSLAVIGLFNAFSRSRLKEKYGNSVTPILALEEPEAHLHPSATKSVGKILQNIEGQKLISTHSGELLAGIPLTKIRRLAQKDGEVNVYSMEEEGFSSDEINKLDFVVRINRGHLFFSRCWLFIEGETEFHILHACSEAMGYDLYVEGVSCVEFAQVGIGKFIKFADQLGINWFLLADGDKEGEKYRQQAKKHLDGRPEAEHILLLDGVMEEFLAKNGFEDIYKGIKGNKIPAIHAVAERIIAKKREVPEKIKEVIEQAIGLAREG